jgi:Rrf2 family iron-sulfur cluster assembly transcriptional regulator
MMADIARNGRDGQPVSLAMVASRTDISRGYLEQLALALRAARLLKSVAGRRGGYLLAREPAAITLAEVIEATIGPICVVDCVDSPEDCPRAENCECRLVYQLINHRITDVLQEYSLADLLDPASPLSRA